MGRLDAFDVGEKKLTIQTEFFPRPSWRIETKVYLAGALKKVYTEELDERHRDQLQQIVDTFHTTRLNEIAENLRARQKS